ncbi:12662_t:CDS:2, partial [Dentiscutata erythropus]
NPDISRRNHTPSEVKRKCNARKKLIFNDTASKSSSSSGSDSESSSNDEDFTMDLNFLEMSSCPLFFAKPVTPMSVMRKV